MRPPSDISVVLLFHDRLAMMPDVFQSLEQQTVEPREIIIVDNPSPASGGLEALVRGRPGMRIVRPRRNLGFAGGMNYGVALASGAYTYLTEDDLVLAPDCLERLLDVMTRDAGIGLAADVIRDRDDGTLLYAGGEVELAGSYRLTLPGRGEHGHPLASGSPRDVGYAPTGSVLARTELLKRLGGFRAEFFMYMEDVDLCLRVRRAGQRIAVVPAARVAHIRPPASRAPDSVEVHKWKNLMAVYVLHAPAAALAVFLVRQVMGRLVRGGPPGERRRLLKAIWWNVWHSPGLLWDRLTGRVERPLQSPGG